MSSWLASPYTWLVIVLTVLIIYLSVTINDVGGEWYQDLNKPPGVVPDLVFGIVWAILYVALLVGGVFLVNTYSGDRSFITLVYAIVVSLTLAWIIAFSSYQMIAFGLFIMVLLLIVTVYLVVQSRPSNTSRNWVPIICFVPFLIWISVATYYNAGIWWLNPNVTEDTKTSG